MKEVLEQIPQEPNTEEALAFYQSTYGYTEDLRVVIQDLRLRIKVRIKLWHSSSIYMEVNDLVKIDIFLRVLWLKS